MSDYLICLYYDDFIKEIDLTNKTLSKINVGSDESNDVILNSIKVERNAFLLEKENDTWYIEDPNRSCIIFNGRNFDRREIAVGEVYEVASLGKKSYRMYVFIKDEKKIDVAYEKYQLNNCNEIAVGYDKNNAISLRDETICDSVSYKIYKEGNNYYIGKVKSKKYRFNIKDIVKCVYLNGRRVYSDMQLKSNDTIYIGGYTLRFYQKTENKSIDGYDIIEEVVYFEAAHGGAAISEGHFKKYVEVIIEEDYPYYEIQSRIFPQLPEDKITIESPRTKLNKPEINWISIFLPPALMVFLFLVVMPMISDGGMYSSMFLLFSCLSVVTAIVNYITQVRKYHKGLVTRVEDYEKVLSIRRNNLNDLLQQEKATLYRLHSDYEQCLRIVENKERRLWERNYSHKDFLEVKLGIGDRTFSIPIQAPTYDITQSEEDELVEQAIKLKNEFSINQSVPITANLKAYNVVSLQGDREQTINVVRQMIMQICVNHSYEEVKLVFIFSEEELGKWEWARWLPHVFDASRQQRYIACNPETVDNMLTNINEIIKARIPEDRRSNMESFHLPYFIFIVADRELLQNNPIVPQLLAPMKEACMSSVFALKDTSWVPPHCKCEVMTDPLKGEMVLDGNRSNTSLFSIENLSFSQMDRVARSMAPIRIKNIASSVGIPNQVSLFDILSIERLEDIQLMRRWQTNQSYKTLSAPIGVKMGGEIFDFNIHEKAHGPHGLVAGTTGSGKSETLLSYIVSMAVNYHPHYVGFVIIDYKGGGMINPIEKLPHLLGTVTNLDDNQINRSLLSLKSELVKRQRLFDRYKINHIDAYQKLYAEGAVEEPMPHLILVVDEFAELKADQPEFMKELISAARIGRSIGIHLILATQKPAGIVDDQIWSNSKFKICLKVSTPEDSKEVLKKSDASYITLPGRAYIQIGNDELFELFQSGYGGVPYIEADDHTIKKKDEHKIYSVQLGGNREMIYPTKSFRGNNDNKETQLSKLVDYVHDQHIKNGIKKVKGPWILPLKGMYYLSDYRPREVLSEYRFYFGAYDNPTEQTQGIYGIDLATAGSLMIYGSGVTGKTTLLKTIMMYGIKTYSPEMLHIYALDFGSRILSIFKEAPHVGGVIFQEQLDRVERLVRFLAKILKERKIVFTNAGITNFKAYNSINSEKIPAIMIVIDNVSFIKELGDTTLEEQLSILVREGTNYGIYFVMTANSTSSVSYKLIGNIANSISFHLSDSMQYSSIFGKKPDILPGKTPGRAVGRLGNKVVEIQMFMPEKGKNEHEITNKIKENISRLKDKKASVHIIPELEEKMYMDEEIRSNRGPNILPIGVDRQQVLPVEIDLNDFGGFMIFGERSSGITNTLNLIMGLLIQNNNEKMNIVVLDNYIKELQKYREYCTYVNDEGNADEVIQKIGEDILAGNISQRTILVINDYDYFVKYFSETIKNTLTKIIDKALYANVNVFIAVKGGQVSGFDNISSAVKKIGSGLVLTNSENALNQLGIKISFDERKKGLRTGQGYLQTMRDSVKVQIYACE